MDAHFPSFVCRHQFANSASLNPALLRYILAERANDGAGLQASNVAALGGWRSRNSLHKEEVFAPLVDAIHSVAETIASNLDYHPGAKLKIDQMWAMANPPGAFNRNHQHPHSLWSGVYYVQVPDNAGALVFSDPRPGNVMFCAQHRPGAVPPPEASLTIEYEPVEGTLMMFPGFLAHSVEPNLSEKAGDAALRIAISFNLTQQ